MSFMAVLNMPNVFSSAQMCSGFNFWWANQSGMLRWRRKTRQCFVANHLWPPYDITEGKCSCYQFRGRFLSQIIKVMMPKSCKSSGRSDNELLSSGQPIGRDSYHFHQLPAHFPAGNVVPYSNAWQPTYGNAEKFGHREQGSYMIIHSSGTPISGE